MSKHLHGINILITRPAHQSQHLINLIQHSGGCCITFPTIAIEPPINMVALENTIKKLAHYDYAIFVSANAVTQSANLIHASWPKLPAHLIFVAIGTGTKNALEKSHLPVHLIPNTFNSEGLLALPEFKNINNRSIALFSGEGGRSLLMDTLQQRGAKIEKIICYRRVMPTVTPQQRSDLLATWKKLPIHIAVITSNESLENLFAMIGASGQTMLNHTPVLGMSERLKEKALQLGLQNIIITDIATDEGIITALLKWKESLL